MSENICPICGSKTISGVAFDNACTQCDYVEETYPDADVLGNWESIYGDGD